jgi:hypothetical protein
MMTGDPNRDAAIRYADREAMADQIADRAHEIAMTKVDDILSDREAIADLMAGYEVDMWSEVQAIIEHATPAMDAYIDLCTTSKEASLHLAPLLRACERMRKIMTDAAHYSVIDDAEYQAEDELAGGE